MTDTLVRHAAAANATYTGCHVYVSFDPQSRADAGLRRFLNVMKGFPGYHVVVKERKPRGSFICQHQECRKPIRTCPHCQRALQGTVEKGVDTALATDLIEAAIDDQFDGAILVSADADFVPAVELVHRRTNKHVIHAYFKPKGQELRNACWAHIYIDDLMGELRGSP
ncbi:MAG: NYN domain-containing protein [Bryobacterales bacterium]|nr:NYN domain-containing protein [Bryobacterales bacterium]